MSSLLRETVKDTITGTSTDILGKLNIDADVGELVNNFQAESDDSGQDGASKPEDEASDEVVELECGTNLNISDLESAVPPDGGRGWFIVLAALFILPVVSVYNSLQAMVVNLLFVEMAEDIREDWCWMNDLGYTCNEVSSSYIIENTHPDDFKDINDISEVYGKTYSLFGIVTAIFIFAFNYRVVAVTGALINIVALIISAFVRNYKALIFLSGFCVGVGNNFLYLSSLVAVLEYFRRRRMLATVLPTLSIVIGMIAITLVIQFLFPEINLKSAKELLIYICLTYVPCLVAGATLKPLNLYVKDSSSHSSTFKGRLLNVEGLAILKSWTLYIMMGIFFCYTYGQNIPLLKLESLTGLLAGWLLSILLLAFKLLGALFTCLFTCTCCCQSSRCCRACSKTMTASSSAILLVVTLSLVGCFQLAIDPMSQSEMVILYCAVFGFITGIVDPVLTATVPLVLGENYLGVVMGLVDFATGLGVILSEEISDAAEKDFGDAIPCFYIGSGFFILAAILSFVLLRFRRFNHQVDISLDGKENSEDADTADEITLTRRDMDNRKTHCQDNIESDPNAIPSISSQIEGKTND